LNLSDRDWNTRYHEMYDPLIIAEANGKQTSSEERYEEAPPTHPLDAYAGEWEARGYPDFAVKIEGNGLKACTVGSLEWSDLRHYHFNVFEWHLVDFNAWMKVRFLVNDHGEIDSISIPIEPAVENVIFVRKPPEPPEKLLTALGGVYILPVDGIDMTITNHEGRVFATQTGSSAEEIKCYKLTDDLVGFRMKRNRLDFERVNNVITRLTIKGPGMTLEALRKE